MYIYAPSGIARTYPYSVGQLRADNPQTSFPSQMSDALLAEWGVYPVTEAPQPTVTYAQNLTEDTPRRINGVWTQTWKVSPATSEQVAERTAVQAADIRAERNVRLVACDWTQLPDAPVDSAAWAAYRQALRDVTGQSGFPWAVTWPSEPN
jgi:hypothetical protein